MVRVSFGPRLVLGMMALAVLGWRLFGCSDETDSTLPLAPANCVLGQPNSGPFEVKLTINSEHTSVPIAIFLGDIEQEAIVVLDTLSVALVTYELPADERYSATALYVSGPDTILVIDSDRITTSSTEFRDAVCWSVDAGEADLRLRVRSD